MRLAVVGDGSAGETHDRDGHNGRCHVPTDRLEDTTMKHDNTLLLAQLADPVQSSVRSLAKGARQALSSLCEIRGRLHYNTTNRNTVFIKLNIIFIYFFLNIVFYY